MRPLQCAAAKGRDRSWNFKPRHYQKRTGIAPIIIAVAALVCLQGCSRPFATPKPPGFQDKAEALRDWDDVAAKIASEMVRQGVLRDPMQPSIRIQEQQNPYYVNAVSQPSPFLREVQESLVEKIVQHGGSVARTPIGASVIDLDLSVVQWPWRHASYGTNTEVAWDASITRGNQVVFDVRGPLYISESDMPLYVPPPVITGPAVVQMRFVP